MDNYGHQTAADNYGHCSLLMMRLTLIYGKQLFMVIFNGNFQRESGRFHFKIVDGAQVVSKTKYRMKQFLPSSPFIRLPLKYFLQAYQITITR
ncbi:hypothetical protein CS542_04940 [Pedobacter sp. IW39]|nr:hypothetical protein CS542_04940 [Pedobacter sp. IW39]